MTAQWTFALCDALAKVHPAQDPRPTSTTPAGDRTAPARFQAFLGEPASFQLAYRPPGEPTSPQVRAGGQAAETSSLQAGVEGPPADTTSPHAGADGRAADTSSLQAGVEGPPADTTSPHAGADGPAADTSSLQSGVEGLAAHTGSPQTVVEGTPADGSSLRVRVEGPAADLVAVSSVELVHCSFLAFPDHDAGYEWDEPGDYPDVLRPLPNGEATVRPGEWAALWFDVTTTDPARAGHHELTVVVTQNGTELHRQPVTVELTGIELPALAIVSSHWMHVDALADHYGVEVFSEEHWTLIDRFMASAAEMGATSLLTPVWTPPLDTAVGSYRTVVQLIDIATTDDGYTFSFDKLRRWLELCRRNGITGVEIAHLLTQWGAQATPGIVVNNQRAFGWDIEATDPRYRELMQALLPALHTVLDEEWDREHVVFHISDEPSGEDGLASYLAAKAVVADLLKGWTVVDALSEHSFWTSGAVEVPVVATDHVEPFLAERPEQLWVYYCVSQNRDVANRFIGMPSARNRAIGHQLFAAGVDGFLHWGFNFWYTQYSVRQVDPFTETSAGDAFPSGDPFIVYPGTDGTPWPSLRHRVFAQAIWDHRALQAVRDRLGTDAALDLIDPDRTLRFDRPVLDPDHYYRARQRMVDALT